jgi:protein Tex
MSKVEISDVHVKSIAKELSVSTAQVTATIELLDEGATVPFISRYRKEITGSMDEVQIAAVRDRFEQLRELDKRRDSILKNIQEQGKLTSELEKKINAALTMTELEDLYLPYKQKRKTRASIAKEKGLEPLATTLLEQTLTDIDAEAAKYIDTEKGVATFEEALAGARDIIAELINEDQAARTSIRRLFNEKGTIKSKVFPAKENEGQKYRDYFEWEEPIAKTPSHRLLAMRRGEKEGFLMLDIAPLEEDAIEIIERQFVQGRGACAEQVKLASKDAYKRLLKPSMETEVRMGTKNKADEEAIRVFSDNLKQLLLSSPLGQKNVLALDPGFRSGCKLVCLDRQGKLLEETVVYPHEPQRQTQQSGAVIMAMCQKHAIEAISIGNGTAGRETEAFVKTLGLPKEILIVMVNESGASVYSASDVAREEFPEYDVTVRGAVSIGRRLMDPLAELVKIDPKAIGVGQYQHDVDQTALKKSLDEVVMNSVNLVGVEINTASKQLLTYVSGLGPQLAQNIIEYRNANGPFKSRSEIKKVARMGEKAFEQAAGFLRIRDGENPLDTSAVHPESYAVVERMAKDLGASVKEIMTSKELRQKIVLKNYVSETIGLPTLQDIFQELDKPGRDPRQTFELFEFAEGVKEMKDLRPGMKLPGIITNVTKFGVFVDIGVHQDGLIHISHLADRFISDPSEVVKVQQKVQVTVLEVDEARKRISLSMKGDAGAVVRPKGTGAGAGSKKEKEVEGDMQSKLNMLMSKFK